MPSVPRDTWLTRRRAAPLVALLLGVLVMIVLASERQARQRGEDALAEVAVQAGDTVRSWWQERLEAQRSAAFTVGIEQAATFTQTMAGLRADFAILLDEDGFVRAIYPERPDLGPGDELVGRFPHIDAVRDGASVGFWATDEAVTASGIVVASAVPAGRPGGVLSVALDPSQTSLPSLLDVVVGRIPSARVQVVERTTGVAIVGPAEVELDGGWKALPVAVLDGAWTVTLNAPPSAGAMLVGDPRDDTARLLLAVLALGLLAAWWWVPAMVQERSRARRRAEEAETVFSQSYTPTLVMDPEYRIVKVNHSMLALTGHEERDLIGKDGLRDVIMHPEDFFTTPPTHMGREDGFTNVVREGRYERADGSLGFGRISGAPIVGLDGEITGWVGEIIDMTDAQDARRALESSREELRYVAFRIAHDLANPLAAVKGYSQLLLTRDDFSPEQQRRFLQQIHDAIEAAVVMVRSLLDRADRVGGEAPEMLALAEVHDWLLRIVGPELAATSGSLDLDSELTEILAPPAALRGVLSNLVSNALKYRREGVPPRIVLRATREPDGAAHLTVSDNGRGVASDQLQAIFAPGERASGQDVAPGHGSGLPEVRRLINLAGGRCWATQGQPVGLVVHVVLPGGDGGTARGGLVADATAPS